MRKITIYDLKAVILKDEKGNKIAIAEPGGMIELVEETTTTVPGRIEIPLTYFMVTPSPSKSYRAPKLSSFAKPLLFATTGSTAAGSWSISGRVLMQRQTEDRMYWNGMGALVVGGLTQRHQM